MITLEGTAYNFLSAGTNRKHADETFRSYGEMLRWIAGQLDRRNSAEGFYLGSATDKWAHQRLSSELWNWTVTAEQWQALHALQARYRGFLHHLREVAPEWTEVARIPYMDNSVEAVQRDKDGNERRVTLTGPSGDACF